MSASVLSNAPSKRARVLFGIIFAALIVGFIIFVQVSGSNREDDLVANGETVTGTAVSVYDNQSMGGPAHQQYNLVFSYTVDGKEYKLTDLDHRWSKSEADQNVSDRYTVKIYYEPSHPDNAATLNEVAK